VEINGVDTGKNYAIPVESITITWYGKTCDDDQSDCFGVISAEIDITPRSRTDPANDFVDGVKCLDGGGCGFNLTYNVTHDCGIVAAFVIGIPGLSDLPLPCPAGGIDFFIGGDACKGYSLDIKFIFIDEKGCRYEVTRNLKCCICCTPSGTLDVEYVTTIEVTPDDPDWPGDFCATPLGYEPRSAFYDLYNITPHITATDCSPAGTDSAWCVLNLISQFEGNSVVTSPISDGDTFQIRVRVSDDAGQQVGGQCMFYWFEDCLGCKSDITWFPWHQAWEEDCVTPIDSCFDGWTGPPYSPGA
jgi:hypothetical protein